MKKILLVSIFIIGSFQFLQAQYIWTGPSFSFSKSNTGSPDSLINQDRITDTVWLTRGLNRGLFNRAAENAYVNSLSPEDTEWAFGTIANWKTLSYDNWEDVNGSNPPGLVNRDMVVHLISDSVYLELKFTSWAQGTGGFAYTRTTCESSATINDTACGTYTSPSGKSWTIPGTYQDTIANKYGCDSLLTINVTFSNYRNLKIRTCESYTSPSGRFTYTKSGIYSDTLFGMASCTGVDSFLTLDVSITPITRISDTLSVCDSYTTPQGSSTYTTSGIYNDTIRTGICDSIFTYHLTVNNSISTNLSETACDAYTSPSGNHTWTFSGNYTDTLFTTEGCDSVLLIALTINRSQTRSVFETSCNRFTSPSGKNTWSQSGVYRDTLQKVNGCDSILIINLTILNNTSSTNNLDVCGSQYISPSGNHVWTSNGTYLDTVLNSQGCDSIMTFNLAFRTSTSSTISPTACKSYLSPSGKYNWTSTGNFKDTVQNIYGCDSIISINLTINNVDASFDPQGSNLVANATSASSYQWMTCSNGNFTPINGATSSLYVATQAGDYALEVTDNNCTDTSDCLSINNVSVKSLPKNLVSLYPNPNNGTFSIRNETGLKITQVTILNNNGQKIKEFKNGSDANYINIQSDLKFGFYLVQLKLSNGSVLNSKILIK